MRLVSLLAFLLIGLQAAAPTNLTRMDEAAYAKGVASHKGKVLLVNFWATWCVPCREEMPALAKMTASLAGKGFSLMTVSADEPEDEKAAVAFLTKSGIAAPAYLKSVKSDDKFISSIDAKWSGALPALVLYDKSGKKVKVWIGESDLKQVRAAIEKLL